MAIQTVTIVGVGLIGGSFGLALRAHGFGGRILGVSSPRTLEEALALGAVDSAGPLEEAVSAADLVYLAQPVDRILDLLPQVRRFVQPHALVTDCGSTKEAIVARAGEVFDKAPWFVGGHPMAGKEGRGVQLAEPELFRGCTYVLTPFDGVLPKGPVVESFVNWLEKIGCRIKLCSAAEHDRIVTWTSHLPQLVSTALASCVDENLKQQQDLEVAGPALRDMTRLGESSYDIWKDIVSTNRGNLVEGLSTYIQSLEDCRKKLGTEELAQYFDRAQKLRRKM